MSNKEELKELRELKIDPNRFFSRTEFERLKYLEILEKGNRI